MPYPQNLRLILQSFGRLIKWKIPTVTLMQLVTIKNTSEYIFDDCSAEIPMGRHSVWYDHEALEKRKEKKPIDSVVAMATVMDIELLTKEQYRELRSLKSAVGNFETKT